MNSNSPEWPQFHMHTLLDADTEATFFDRLSTAARELGFDHCAYGMRMPLPLSNPKISLINNYSIAWQERYASQNYLAIDPTVAHGISSTLPLVWSEATFSSAPQLRADAAAHGLKVGWAQSSYDAKGVVGMLTLARGHDALTDSELRKNSLHMSWLVQAAHAGMTRLASARTPTAAAITLTAREIEVLRWSADGKTSSEVGQIMAISERTVNFHVNNALEKLGAVNKTGGVIKAVMLRLI